MVRTDQYIGLPPESVRLIQGLQRVQYNEIEKAFGGPPFPLWRYYNTKGECLYEEFLQATPWSSGPCYFIALREYVPNSIGPTRVKWAVEDIDKA